MSEHTNPHFDPQCYTGKMNEKSATLALSKTAQMSMMEQTIGCRDIEELTKEEDKK